MRQDAIFTTDQKYVAKLQTLGAVQSHQPHAIAGFVDSGHQLWLGCLPTASERVWSVDEVVARVLGALRPLELGERLADGLVLTPACGLAGWSARGASSALRTLVRAAALVDEALRT